MSLASVAAALRSGNNFVITSHTSLEGDALGSEIALCYLLRRLGKSAVIVNQDEIPYGHEFLPGREAIRRFKKGRGNLKFDTLVLVDCSDLARCGQVADIAKQAERIINIDHHISNSGFGSAIWVDPGSSCACEMLYLLYRYMRQPIDRNIAVAIYTGIVADTGSFRYANTSSRTHAIAAKLLKYGLDVSAIYRSIYENMPLPDARLLSALLPRLERSADGRIVWIRVKRQMIRHKQIAFDLSEHILTFLRSIKDAEVAVLLKDNLGPGHQVRVNFRSQGRVDVNKIAQFFGGGGHRSASGATLVGDIDSIARKIIRKVKEELP